MPETKGTAILNRIRKRWTATIMLSRILFGLSVVAVLFTALYRFVPLNPVSIILLFLVFIAFLVFSYSRRRLSQITVARMLNRSVPSLEESADLFFHPYESLNILQKFQVKKIELELVAMKSPAPFKKQLINSILLSGLAVILCALMFLLPVPVRTPIANQRSRNGLTTVGSEHLPAQIKEASVLILPPAYTGKAAHNSGFNLAVEDGGRVIWQMQTTVGVSKVELVFNDGRILPLSADNAKQKWKTQTAISRSGFYQVKINDKLSDFYRVEVILDKPPVIAIQSPAPATSIAYNGNKELALRTTLSDDYGITSARISATISSGEGEAVKFKEQKLHFENFIAGGKEYRLQKAIDCHAMGMQPGDELYFFITVTDNHQQQINSEVYVVTLQDTASLLSIDGIVTALDVKQEFFRSQRQIIIETGQLLKNKTRLSASEFKSKSNDLGIDQQLLRLRYGKFLGEETNIEIGDEQDGGHNDDHNEDHSQKDFTTDANDILDQFSHKHDIADDASFFDPETKIQLKKMLGEMWNAEIKLRTFLPKEALVFENKALLILKDLQQKSRAYVPKTGFTPTPLKPEKRLTGDLSKILQPQHSQNIEPSDDKLVIARRAISVLEQLKETGVISESSGAILQEAFRQLTIAAANEPSVYLPALASVKRIISNDYRMKDINGAAMGLQKLLPPAAKLPNAPTANNSELSKQYYRNITKLGRRQE